MTRTLLALLVSAALSAPAAAGGSISLSITAENAREARALLRGLAAYGVTRDLRSRGHVSQNGVGNAAALSQTGAGHRGLIRQQGDGHQASLTQTGERNRFGIFQFGSGTTGHVTQTGTGAAGLLFQYGF